MGTSLESRSSEYKAFYNFQNCNPWKNITSPRVKASSKKQFEWKSFNVPSEYIFDLLDEKVTIPIALEKIKDEIEFSKSLLLLKTNWDEEGALPIDRLIFQTSIKFLIEYSSYLYKNKNVIITPPEINPCKDGTIDLSWRSTKTRLLINFRYAEKDKISAYYYGDFYNNLSPIKGFISVNEFSEFLAIWMKDLA